MPNLHSPHEINDEEPDRFTKEFDIWLGLKYRIANGEYEFSYKRIRVADIDPADLIERFERAPWNPFMRKADFEQALLEAIEIRGDTIIQVDAIVEPDTTPDNDIFWSKRTDAIMTLHDRKSLYGELRYWNKDDEKWQKRVTHDLSYCSRIRFKAKHNLGGPPNQKHKFSYNVRLRNKNGHMEEYEIDPDIQNPKV